MTSLNIFRSDPYDFLKEVTQSKKRKKHIRKTFVAHQKFSKIFFEP